MGATFTERARRVVFFAQEEARILQNNSSGTEHLLLGLIREADSLASRVLDQRGGSRERVREWVSEMQEETKSVGAEPMTPPQPGNLGILKNEDGRDQVEVAISIEAAIELANAMRAKDHFGYVELHAAGKIPLLPVGTEVKLLRVESDGCLHIRITSGTAMGALGWVLSAQFDDQGPDPRPFPPPVDAGESLTAMPEEPTPQGRKGPDDSP